VTSPLLPEFYIPPSSADADIHRFLENLKLVTYDYAAAEYVTICHAHSDQLRSVIAGPPLRGCPPRVSNLFPCNLVLHKFEADAGWFRRRGPFGPSFREYGVTVFVRILARYGGHGWGIETG